MGGASLWEGDFSLDILCLWANPAWANSFIMNPQLLPESARSRVPWPVRGWGWDAVGGICSGLHTGESSPNPSCQKGHMSTPFYA